MTDKTSNLMKELESIANGTEDRNADLLKDAAKVVDMPQAELKSGPNKPQLSPYPYNRGEYYAYWVRMGEKNLQSFALLPLNKSTPFIRGIFSVEQRALYLHHKETFDNLQLVPKINEFGEQEGKGNRGKVERRTIPTNYEYQISKPEDLEWFIRSFIINADQVLEFINTLPEVTAQVVEEQGEQIITDKETLPTI